MMRISPWRRWALGVAVCGGCLFAGPCGITSLQLRDFVISSVIRTSVAALAGISEAAIINAAQGTDDG